MDRLEEWPLFKGGLLLSRGSGLEGVYCDSSTTLQKHSISSKLPWKNISVLLVLKVLLSQQVLVVF